MSRVHGVQMRSHLELCQAEHSISRVVDPIEQVCDVVEEDQILKQLAETRFVQLSAVGPIGRLECSYDNRELCSNIKITALLNFHTCHGKSTFFFSTGGVKSSWLNVGFGTNIRIEIVQ